MKNSEKVVQYSAYPTDDATILQMFEDSHAAFWTNKSISFIDDRYDTLDEAYKDMVKKILFFFANADKLVADNITENFTKLDLPHEADFFLSYQVFNENIHAITYGDAIEAYIKDEDEKRDCYNALNGSDLISEKLQWMKKWVDSGNPEHALLAFIIVESIFFSSIFASIFWLRELRLPLTGFFKGNLEILKDEVKHYEFSTYIWNHYYNDALPKDEVFTAIKEAVNFECRFVDHMTEKHPKMINVDNLKKYVKHVANIVVSNMGFKEKLYGANETEHGLRFMDSIGIQPTVNFFEKTSNNYVKLSGEIDLDDF